MTERIDFETQARYIQEVRERIGSIRPDRKPPTYYIRTFGCQMNENESEKYTGMLEMMGFTPASDMETADFVLFNTCCVRENAELKVFGHLGALKGLKREKPWMMIAVAGCMMQEPHVVEEIKNKYKHVDLVFGTRNIHELPKNLYERLTEEKCAISVYDTEGYIPEGVPLKREHKYKAWLSIMYGCNNFCSYCIVPYVRGRERSRAPFDILEEARILAEDGVKEITLLGQNVNSYGKTLEEKTDFTELLYRLSEVKGIERIRFMTSHPKDISDSLIIAMSELDKVCKHLHLPLQAGSDRILKEMNRRYTKQRYMDIVSFAREKMPRIAITTDIIVGFPGETEEDFLETLDVVRKTEYDMAYTFIYSVRKGTKAAEREDQIPKEVKNNRFQRLLEVQDAISLKKNREYIGRIEAVLNEGPSKTDKTVCTGRTDTNKIVNFMAPEDTVGEIINVRITDAGAWSLEGETV
jgi:tRNA-2-methylthio-N6-dimethylallyladenosine synthase